MYDCSIGTMTLALDMDTSEDATAVYTDGRIIWVSDKPEARNEGHMPLRKFREIAKTMAEAKERLSSYFDLFLRADYPRLYYEWAHQKERFEKRDGSNSVLDYIEWLKPAALMDNIWADFGAYLRRLDYRSVPDAWKVEAEVGPLRAEPSDCVDNVEKDE